MTVIAEKAKKSSIAQTMDGKITARFELVTVEIATEWLTRSNQNYKPDSKFPPHIQYKQNRNESQDQINYLVRQSDDEKFLQTGDTIKFSEAGDLFDGQHRLWMIILTKQPRELLVVRGLPISAFAVIDQNRRRTASDVLSAMKVKNPSRVASTIRWVIQFERRKVGWKESGISLGIDNQDIINFLEINQDIISVVGEVNVLHKMSNKLVRVSVMAGLYWVLSEIDQERAWKFINRFYNPEHNSDIMYKLRKHIFKIRTTPEVHITLRTITGIFLKIWNAEFEGLTLNKVPNFNPGEPLEYPEKV